MLYSLSLSHLAYISIYHGVCVCDALQYANLLCVCVFSSLSFLRSANLFLFEVRYFKHTRSYIRLRIFCLIFFWAHAANECDEFSLISFFSSLEYEIWGLYHSPRYPSTPPPSHLPLVRSLSPHIHNQSRYFLSLSIILTPDSFLSPTWTHAHTRIQKITLSFRSLFGSLLAIFSSIYIQCNRLRRRIKCPRAPILFILCQHWCFSMLKKVILQFCWVCCCFVGRLL